MLAFLDTLPPLQAVAVCGLGIPAGTLAVSFVAYEAACFVRLALRGW